MSRLTGSEAQGLMEAYNAVYTPQELTEEQIWEEVESWVNSLLEEGYDLSDYTWEEMYEAYINEQGRGASVGSNPNVSQNPIARAIRGDGPSRTMTPAQINQARMRPGTSPSRPQIGSLPPSARQVTQYPAGVPTGVGGGNAGASVQPPAKPAAPASAPKPAAPAPAPRPGTSGAAAKPAPAPAAKPVPTPTATTGFKLAQQGVDLSKPSVAPTTTPTPAAAPTPAPKPSALAQRVAGYKAGGPVMGARERMLNQSFDLFDVIKGHLLDEGYADNEDAALAIMANMSEEWRESIVEGLFDFLPKSRTVTPGMYGKDTVLSIKKGVEGVSDKSRPGTFTPIKGGFDKIDAERYSKEQLKQGKASGGINLANRRVTPNRIK